MKCPKCGGEIPFYDLKPNCKHCGVNIMFYTQDAALSRDAKRTELEGAAARMIIARVKAAFIGSKLAIARMVLVLAAVGVLALPFSGVRYTVPFFDHTYSAGLIGIITAYTGGFLMKLPAFLGSALLARHTLIAVIDTVFVALLALLAVVILVIYLIGFINLTKSTKALRIVALVGACVALAGQVVSLILKLTAPESSAASVTFGFGGVAACAVWLALFFVNRAMLKKGVEPVYKPNDIKRRDMLKKVRAGEVNLDDLPLPVFESEEEHAERLKALEEALRAEEEGKEL